MRESVVLKFIKGLALLAVLLVLVFLGMRALVGSKGSGLPYLDVLFVPDEWFVPARVTLLDPSTVRVEGYASDLTWTGTPADREWLVSGSTLVLTEANLATFPAAPDGTVTVKHTFSAGASQQATGWHVVKIQQYDLAQPKATAFVIVDLTRGVWLRRAGYFRWDEVPME